MECPLVTQLVLNATSRPVNTSTQGAVAILVLSRNKHYHPQSEHLILSMTFSLFALTFWNTSPMECLARSPFNPQ